MKTVFTTGEAAKICKVSQQTIIRCFDSGQLKNGREKSSIDYFMAAGKNPLYTTPTKPFTNAGICAMRMKDDKAAEEYLATALRLSPTNTQALFWLALRIERKLGNRDTEARYASQLRRRFVGSPEHRLLTQGQYD